MVNALLFRVALKVIAYDDAYETNFKSVAFSFMDNAFWVKTFPNKFTYTAALLVNTCPSRTALYGN